MPPEEIKNLPNLHEAVDQVLKEEAQILIRYKNPELLFESTPSPIHRPRVEYSNDYDVEKFIAVRLTSRDPQRPEKFAFKPNLKNRAFLFRGQSSFYEPSVPSLLRKKEGRFVVENIFYEEFVLALKDHPLIKLFWNGIELNGHLYFFEVNFYGLAQHYGLKTAVMDLTSDVDAAKFFAVTTYNEKDDSYSPIFDESRYGAFYYWNNIRHPFAFQAIPGFGENLSNIGLQVFPRSGKQKGFLFSMFRGQNFNEVPFVEYKLFRHDANISKQIYKKARKGRIYFPEDELSSLAQRIRKSKVLSGEAFFENLKSSPNDDKDKNYEECKNAGITIDIMKPHITFKDFEKDMYCKKIKAGFWQKFCRQIVFPNDKNGVIMNEFMNLPDNPKYKKYFEWK